MRVDLILRTPRFREDRFRDLFRDEPTRTPPAERRPEGEPAPRRESTAPPRDPAKPVEIVFEDIRRRVSILPVGVEVSSQTFSPDGRSLLLTATAAGQQNLYLYSMDELAREPAVARQLTSTAGNKSDAQFTPDGREVFYLEQGRISVIPIESRQARAVSVNAEMDVDFSQEKMEVFRQAWTYMRDGFYDDKFHGVNWHGGARPLRAARRGRADERRTAPAAQPDGRRAERVASRRLRRPRRWWTWAVSRRPLRVSACGSIARPTNATAISR